MPIKYGLDEAEKRKRKQGGYVSARVGRHGGDESTC
jgi:hypothetical protein